MERTPRSINEAEQLGGYDADDWEGLHDYRAEHYSNKPNHFERSVVHQPNHEKKRSKIINLYTYDERNRTTDEI